MIHNNDKQEDEDQPMHFNQASFIKQFNSENGIYIRNKNLVKEESCWSESLKRVELTDLSQIKGDDEKDKKTLKDNSLLLLQDQSIDDLQRMSKYDSYMLSLTRQKSMHRMKYGKNLIDEIHPKFDSEHHSIYQGTRLQVLQDEDIFQSHTFRKSPTTAMLNNEQIQIFKNKIAFITKLKVQMTKYLKLFTNIQRNRSYGKQVRLQINDMSDVIDSDVNSEQRYFSQVFGRQFWRKYCNMPLLDIQEQPGFVVKLLQVVINFLYLLLFSLIIVFQVKDDFEQRVITVIQCLWSVEIVINLNFKVYIDSLAITKRFDIFIIYIKKKLIFDLIPLLITFIPHFGSDLYIVIQILQFIKLQNLFSDAHLISQQLSTRVRHFYLVQLFNLILKLFIIAHMISCLWYLLGLVEITYLGQPQTWFENSIGADMVWWKLYLAAIYWTLTLMTTGSNISTTVLQTFFTSFIMFFTSIAFGYILSVIGLILAEMDKKDENKRRDIGIVNEYMRKRNISKYILIL